MKDSPSNRHFDGVFLVINWEVGGVGQQSPTGSRSDRPPTGAESADIVTRIPRPVQPIPENPGIG